MQIKKSYKQPCPSCGAGVLIKDAKLVGKKVDCPECKFRFVAEPPKEQEESKEKSKKKKPESKEANTAANGKGPKDKTRDKPTQEKAAREKPAEDADADDKEGDKKGKKKKKKTRPQLSLGSNKLKFGLALAAVGLVVLAVAASLIMSGGTPAPVVPPNNNVVQVETPPPPPPETKEEFKLPEMPEVTEPVVIAPPIKPPSALDPASPSFTNLLPNDTEHVARLFLKNTLESVVGTAAKEAYPLNDLDGDFAKRLGFPLSPVDSVLRADRYSSPGWSFTVVHMMAKVDEPALVKTLGLKEEPAIKERKYYSGVRQAWVEKLGRLAVGSPSERAAPPKPADVPVFVHIFDEQTIIFADKAPLVALLEGAGRFKYFGEDKDGLGVRFGDTTYLTIKPELKAIMDRMEKDAGETILFSSATAMDAARITLDNSGRIAWQFRQVWDIGQLLEANRTRVKVLGTGVFQKDARHYQLHNQLACLDDLDAQEVEKELHGRATPQLATALEKLLGKKVKVAEPRKEGDMPMTTEEPPKEEVRQSEIRLVRDRNAIDFQLDLLLENLDYGRFYNAAALVLFGMRTEMKLALRQIERDRLGRAVAELGEKGLTPRQVEPGRFPPGSFKRPPSSFRTTNQPSQRVSWLAGLLPFMGHDTIHRRIDFNSSWQDPNNWLAARTLVPELLDPRYPEDTFTASHPNLDFRVGSTHYVGIAGVGLDAGSYPVDDPAYLHKRGVLGNERSASLDDVRDGHGLSNTILMIQVPYDGTVGPTPWIAGGGATLRGVPETNCIEPFVLGRDRDGKPILHNGKRGTFAVMTDGSVRFIDQAISDDVFKAMCTVKGPLPPNYKLGTQVNTVVINPAPKAPAKK